MTAVETGSGSRLGPTRARVLALLQDAGAAMDAPEIGRRLGMHPNSVRFHLDALTESGLVARDREPRSAPGRPKVTYASTAAAPDMTRRRYRMLAEMLSKVLQDNVPAASAVAERAGRSWSASLADSRSQGEPSPQGDPGVLVDMLDELGFASRVVDDGESLRVEVDHCPFLEVAAEHQDVVCALHLGLMRGVLQRMRSPIRVRDLEPLVAPSLCVAHLSTAGSEQE
jgi:predicted ArsR family transcriptional regulator